jgi:3'(2'), 5'-bisphosphate nucleotidase
LELPLRHEAIDLGELFDVMRRAGKAILDYYESDYVIHSKSDDTPVTAADLASHDIISRYLSSTYPDIPILSEESEHESYEIRRNWLDLWILDPLDGTQEFIRRTGDFTINLAYVRQGKVVLGVIYQPIQDKLYYAIHKEGAYEYTEKIRLRVSIYHSSQSGCRVLASKNYLDAETAALIQHIVGAELISVGGSIKFIYIAQGKGDYYPRLSRIMEWDVAAAQIIIEEAGGSLVDYHSKRALTYNNESLRLPPFEAKGDWITS